MSDVVTDFYLSKIEGGYLQRTALADRESILMNDDLESVIERLLIEESITRGSNSAGLLGEILGVSLFDEEIGIKIEGLEEYEGVLIKHDEPYTINSSGKYVAKLGGQGSAQVFILNKKDRRNGITDPKFGFTAAEIDGLYMLKRKGPKNREKRLYVLEVKTGEVRLKKRHIIDDVLKPLQAMYGCPVEYVVIGFRDELFSKGRRPYLRNNLVGFHEALEEEGFNFIPLSFPFNKAQFESYLQKVESLKTGIIKCTSALYNSTTGQITLTLPSTDRKIKGTLIEKS